MTACTHSLFCGKRMALGDRENGCNDVDEAICSPVMTIRRDTPTAPASPEQQPYRKCSNCYRRVTKREFQQAAGQLSCPCGCWSWIEL
jgi:hypothetical protein